MFLGASGMFTPAFIPQFNCAAAGAAINKLRTKSITEIFFIL
jgi:hypothetical protein